MEKEKFRRSFLVFASAALAIAVGAAAVILFSLAFWLEENRSILQSELAQTKNGFFALEESLNNKIGVLNADLAATRRDLAIAVAQRDHLGLQYNDVMEKYLQEKARMDDLNSQIGQIKGSVDTLEKLKAIDEELLKKYSKIYFLNENYIPESLAKVDEKYVYNPKENYLIHSKTWPFLQVMMSSAATDGVDLKIISAYRSFNEQNTIKSSYRMVYGSGANQFSADQGYSEHQLGTTVDFTTSSAGASFSGFEKSAAYKWLLQNAHQYGFTLSYPENNDYYQFEPWHWRFVGRDLAEKLHDEGKHFYDLDQREINEYLISFFD